MLPVHCLGRAQKTTSIILKLKRRQKNSLGKPVWHFYQEAPKADCSCYNREGLDEHVKPILLYSITTITDNEVDRFVEGKDIISAPTTVIVVGSTFTI